MLDSRWILGMVVALEGCWCFHPHDDDDTGTAPTCDQTPPDPYPVPADPTCGTPTYGTFDPVVEWSWSANPLQPDYDQVIVTPVVVRLDGDDIPDVVFTAFSDTPPGGPGALTAISGADGATLWSEVEVGGAHPRGTGGVAVGDLDGDGRPEVVVVAVEGILCVDADGGFEWLAPMTVDGSSMPAIGDLDGDGYAEVVMGSTVLEHDGTVRWIGTGGQGGRLHQASFPVDLDGDGRMEVVAGDTVYEADGTVRRTDGDRDGKPGIADFDGDGIPEIVVAPGNGTVRLVGLDGVIRWSVTFADNGGGTPVIADLDGDGAPEIGIADADSFQVLDTDGSVLWTTPTQDKSSALTSASVFDFEQDGHLELVYADEQTLWVFDGATGAVRYQLDSHSSGTVQEYPVIADVNNDGSADIVVANNDYWYPDSTGITVIGDLNASWGPARPVWNQHAYFVSNVDDDGGIPPAAGANLETFQAANLDPAPLSPEADLAVGAPTACVAECSAGVAWLSIPVENRGAAASADVTVTLSKDDGGVLTQVAEIAVPAVAAGSMGWAGPVAVGPADYGTDGLVITVRSDAAECDAADDTWVSPAFPCR